MIRDNNNAYFFVKCAICNNIIQQNVETVNERNVSRLIPGTIICQRCQIVYPELYKRHIHEIGVYDKHEY